MEGNMEGVMEGVTEGGMEGDMEGLAWPWDLDSGWSISHFLIPPSSRFSIKDNLLQVSNAQLFNLLSHQLWHYRDINLIIQKSWFDLTRPWCCCQPILANWCKIGL